MTDTALITMLLAWGYVLFFTIYFFRKVLKTPQKKNTQEENDQ